MWPVSTPDDLLLAFMLGVERIILLSSGCYIFLADLSVWVYIGFSCRKDPLALYALMYSVLRGWQSCNDICSMYHLPLVEDEERGMARQRVDHQE